MKQHFLFLTFLAVCLSLFTFPIVAAQLSLDEVDAGQLGCLVRADDNKAVQVMNNFLYELYNFINVYDTICVRDGEDAANNTNEQIFSGTQELQAFENATMGSINLRFARFANDEVYYFTCDAVGFEADVYRWNFSDGTILLSTRGEAAHRFFDEGEYTIECEAASPTMIAQGEISLNVDIVSGDPDNNNNINDTDVIDDDNNSSNKNNSVNNVSNVSNANVSANITGNISANVSQNQNNRASVELRVKEWYPKRNSYVFECVATGTGFTPQTYSWYYGDGDKLLNIVNGNTFHTFEENGQYTIRCEGHDANGNVHVTDEMTINVREAQPLNLPDTSLSLSARQVGEREYILSCDSQGYTATNFYWYFGDDTKLEDIDEGAVFHRYDTNAPVSVTCQGYGFINDTYVGEQAMLTVGANEQIAPANDVDERDERNNRSNDTAPAEESDLITVCHIEGSMDNQRTMRVNRAALPAHMEHGDRVGPCDGNATFVDDGNMSDDDMNASVDNDTSVNGRSNMTVETMDEEEQNQQVQDDEQDQVDDQQGVGNQTAESAEQNQTEGNMTDSADGVDNNADQTGNETDPMNATDDAQDAGDTPVDNTPDQNDNTDNQTNDDPNLIIIGDDSPDQQEETDELQSEDQSDESEEENRSDESDNSQDQDSGVDVDDGGVSVVI